MMLRILSLGAGVQSTTLALMACDGTLPNLAAAIFADTGWEPPATYTQVDLLEAELNKAGIPLYRVRNGDLRSEATSGKTDGRNSFAAIPYYVLHADGTKGMGQRQCTHEYKLKPINKKIRELLGADPPHYRRVRRGRVAEEWIGFSTDEIGRVNDKRDVLYIDKRHPLLELGMSRKDCARWLAAAGWAHTAKSACIGCPMHGNKQWREMRDNRPAEWADAVEFDRQIRTGGSRPLKNGATAYLHASCVPLDQAPIGTISRREYKDLQGDMFDLLADLLENGPEDGCSPHGCRSGDPVTIHAGEC